MTELDKPAWRLFEEEVNLLVEEFGYSAETTRPSSDGGIDVMALGRRGRVIIQCKLFSTSKVRAPTIRELVGTQVCEKADAAICVTTTGFTKGAQEAAEAGGVILFDREKLLALCRRKNLTIPSLTWLKRPPKGLTSLAAGRVNLGRSVTANVVIADPTVSRQHAVFERRGLRLQLRDCGSTNGTIINEQPLRGACPINYNDEIRIGSLLFRVVWDHHSQ